MFYYYHLLRFHIYNQIHIRNRTKFDKSWTDVLESRRKLRVISGQKSLFQKIKEYKLIKQ